ncbi:MAG TPA: cohesin domain-containing protein, partial [Planctomycetota bacterium]|nr:cohesin domain-containing protein [Planctomycetota bacterium]
MKEVLVQLVKSRSAPRRWGFVVIAAALTAVSFRAAHANGEPASYLNLYNADGIFILSEATGLPGETVTVTMSFEALRPVKGFDFAIVFDARVLDLLSVTPILNGGAAWEVFDLHVVDRVNTECTPQICAWRDDIYGRAIFNEADPSTDLPASTRNDVLQIELKIHDDAPSGFADVIFNELHEDP